MPENDDIEQELPEVELSEEDVQSVEASVLEANEGKTKEDLTEEIEAALATEKETQVAITVKMDEIKARDGNDEMSDEDAFAIYESEIEAPVDDPVDPFESISTNIVEKPAGSDSPEIQSKRLNELEGIVADPAIADFIAFTKGGGNIGDYISQQGSFIDYANMDAKDVLEMAMNAESLSEEDKETERDAFDLLSPMGKKSMVKDMRQTLNSAQNDKLSKFMKQPVQRQVDQDAMNRKVDSDLNLLSRQLTGTNYHGWDIPEEAVADAVNALKTGEISFANADGSPNVKLMLEAALWVKNKGAITKANAAKGKLKGTRQEQKKRAMPRRGSSVTTRMISTDGSLNDAVNAEKKRRREAKAKNSF